MLFHCRQEFNGCYFIVGKNLFRVMFKNKQPERNELFLPRRMAYVVDLEDEFADSDIPTTMIRSKADCPTLEVSLGRGLCIPQLRQLAQNLNIYL